MRVLFHQHLFDENPKEYEVEATTFGEILQKTGIKGRVVIYDWGDRLEYPACHDLQPKSKTIRVIRVPGSWWTDIRQKVYGGVAAVAGIVLSAFGLPWLGAPLIMAGSALIAASFIKPPEAGSVPNLPEYIDGYSLYGGNNPSAIGKIPPVVIGKHKILPPVVGTGITRVESGTVSYGGTNLNDGGGFNANQYAKFMYCLGYITDDTLVTDIKLGGSLFCSNREGIRNGQLVIDGNFIGTAELRQDGQLPEMYQKSIKETQINTEIKGMSEDYAKAFFVTQPNTVGININLYASGFYKQNDDGSIGWTSVGFVVYYRAAGEENWNELGSGVVSGNKNQLWRKQFNYDIPEAAISNNPSCLWEVLVCKTSGETGSKFANRIMLSGIQSVTTLQPLSGKIAGKLTYLCCEFLATENNMQAVKNLTCVVQNAIPVWNGTDWNTKAFTSNPAAWYRWVLKSPALPKQAPDNRIIDLETLYDWCEVEGRTVNTVISSALQVRDLLNNILSTSQASFTLKNGLYSYSHDKTRPNPVALITPKNSSEFTITKNFAETVDALDVTFKDEAGDWEETTETILPYGATDYTNASKITLWGTTNYEQAVWIARYLLACNIQRAESYTLKVGIEHYSIPRGERIIIQQDILSVGVCSGRIISVDASTEPAVLTIDETVQPQGGESFGVKVFMQDGTIRTINVIESAVASNQLQISQGEASGILAGDLYAYGPTDMEVLDCVVKDKNIDENGGCELTLIPYDESIFEATDKPVPAYNPKIYGAGMSWDLPMAATPDSIDTIQTPHQGNIYYDFAEYSHEGSNNTFVNRGTLRELSVVSKPLNVFNYSDEIDARRGLNVCWATPNVNLTSPVSFFVDNAFWKSTTITFMSKGFTLTQVKKVFMSYNDVESQNEFSIYSEDNKMFVESQGVAIDISAVDWVNSHYIIITRSWDTFEIKVYEDTVLKVIGSFSKPTALIAAESSQPTLITSENNNILSNEGAGVLRSALNRNILFYIFGDSNGVGLTTCTIGDIHIYDWELSGDYIENIYKNGILLLSVDKLARYLGEFMGVPPFVRLGDSFKWTNTTNDTFQQGKIYWLTPSGWALLNGNAEAATQGS